LSGALSNEIKLHNQKRIALPLITGNFRNGFRVPYHRKIPERTNLHESTFAQAMSFESLRKSKPRVKQKILRKNNMLHTKKPFSEEENPFSFFSLLSILCFD